MENRHFTFLGYREYRLGAPSRPDQLDENAGASGLVIDPALFAKAEAVVGGLERVR